MEIIAKLNPNPNPNPAISNSQKTTLMKKDKIEKLPRMGKMYEFNLEGRNKVLFDNKNLIVVQIEAEYSTSGICGEFHLTEVF